MPQNPSMTGSSHPAPHRERAPYVSLAFGLFAAPIGWALHLLVNYSIAGQNCVGASAAATASAGGALSAIFLIDLGAVILAAVAGFVAYEPLEKDQGRKSGRCASTGSGRRRPHAFSCPVRNADEHTVRVGSHRGRPWNRGGAAMLKMFSVFLTLFLVAFATGASAHAVPEEAQFSEHNKAARNNPDRHCGICICAWCRTNPARRRNGPRGFEIANLCLRSGDGALRGDTVASGR